MLCTSPGNYFYEEFTNALKKQNVKVSVFTERYVSDLLTYFIETENLLTQDNKEETLVFLLKDALETESISTRFRSFKRLGDIALFSYGVLSKRIGKKIVGRDYYLSMGKSAYGNISSFSPVFGELSQKFFSISRVLEKINFLIY